MMTQSIFSQFSKWFSHKAGQPAAFGVACFLILVWALTGPAFHFSDTWQLVINTSTTIVTFLMVFLIQNTQNREMMAVHLKLNELIRSMRGAHNTLMAIEDLSEEDLHELDKKYKSLLEEIAQRKLQGKKDTGTPELG
jgi:low affinity Fe/Cu permease